MVPGLRPWVRWVVALGCTGCPVAQLPSCPVGLSVLPLGVPYPPYGLHMGPISSLLSRSLVAVTAPPTGQNIYGAMPPPMQQRKMSGYFCHHLTIFCWPRSHTSQCFRDLVHVIGKVDSHCLGCIDPVPATVAPTGQLHFVNTH